MLSFWIISFWTTLGGCVGGALYVIASLTPVAAKVRLAGGHSTEHISVENGEQANAVAPAGFFLQKASRAYWLANAATGFGGAWATLLASIWARRAPLTNSMDDHLALIGMSVIGGYAGSRILPAVAERLTRQLLDQAVAATQANARDAETSRKKAKASEEQAQTSQTMAEDSQAKAERAKRDAQIAGKAAEVNAYLSTDPGRHTKRRSTSYVGELTNLLQGTPTSRAATWALAWLYADLGNHAAAVKTLQSFIAAKEACHEGDTKDVADAFWNIAWYIEESDNIEDEGDVAVEALQEAVRIMPDYGRSLREEGGFENLRKLPAFQQQLHL